CEKPFPSPEARSAHALRPLPGIRRLSVLNCCATPGKLLLSELQESRTMAATQPMMKSTHLESTRELVLSYFPPELHQNSSLRGLADRVETFTRAGTRRGRLDALVALYSWVRHRDAHIPPFPGETPFQSLHDPNWRREGVWLSVLYSCDE